MDRNCTQTRSHRIQKTSYLVYESGGGNLYRFDPGGGRAGRGKFRYRMIWYQQHKILCR